MSLTFIAEIGMNHNGNFGLLPELKSNLGITDGLIRLSVGIEHFEDLINDISDSLDLI